MGQVKLKTSFGKIKAKLQTSKTINKTKKQYYETWHNPENITDKKKALQAATAYMVQWEREILGGVIKKVSANPTFSESAEQWLSYKSSNFSANHIMKATKIIKTYNEIWGPRLIKSITPLEVEAFFKKLNVAQYERIVGTLRPEFKTKLDNAAINYGIRKAASDGEFSRPVLADARNGKQIEWSSIEAICRKLKLSVDIFERKIISKPYSENTF